MKTIYPISTALPADGVDAQGALHRLHSELSINTNLTIRKVNDNVEITGAIPLTIAQVDAIIVAGGEVDEYLMAIKAPLSTLEADVPSGMPDDTKPGTTSPIQRKFNDWLAPNNVWTTDTHFWFQSINVARKYLKGSEIKSLFVSGLITDVVVTTDSEFVAAQNA